MAGPLLPAPLPPSAALELLASAQRCESPGPMVWHHWSAPDTPLPPLVLLHGGSGSWTHWLRNIAALRASGYALWLPDLPGFGDSAPPPAGCDADAMVGPLFQGLCALLPQRSCILVGFSLGGLVAGMLAARAPEMVQRLVLVGAVGMGVVTQPQYQLQGWRHLPDAAAQDSAHRHNLAALMLHDARCIDAATLALHRHNVWRDRLPRRRLAHTDALAQHLPLVQCPVDAIYGAQDAIYRHHLGALQAAFGRASPRLQNLQFIDQAGHWVQYEQPQAFQSALQRALASSA